MSPPVHIGEGGNIQSGCDVCDSLDDNPRISGTAEARLRLQIMYAYGGLEAVIPPKDCDCKSFNKLPRIMKPLSYPL